LLKVPSLLKPSELGCPLCLIRFVVITLCLVAACPTSIFSFSNVLGWLIWRLGNVLWHLLARRYFWFSIIFFGHICSWLFSLNSLFRLSQHQRQLYRQRWGLYWQLFLILQLPAQTADSKEQAALLYTLLRLPSLELALAAVMLLLRRASAFCSEAAEKEQA
jgi:hypothetical protein